MLHAGPKAFFYLLSRSAFIKRLATRYGLSADGGFAHRFIAGETIEDAIAAARGVQARGMHLTLDYLGESVGTTESAAAATQDYLRLIDVIVAGGIERNLSLKLTQLGLDVDRATCVDNLRRILDTAGRHGFFVRIDMESSQHTDVTLEVFETLWELEHRNIGLALQACLYRTEADVRRLNALGASVRLVKGAYREPATLAHPRREDVDEAFLRLMRLLLAEGTMPAIATHDERLIDETCAHATATGIAPDRFEFEMLYGIRRDLQSSLGSQGYRVRIYVPFGREWFPYFMRRLGERPANIGFVIRTLMAEGRERDSPRSKGSGLG
jgi:proline dehydrogenase